MARSFNHLAHQVLGGEGRLMASRRLGRMVAGAAMTGAVVMTGAGPALAHFCSKGFNPTAAAHAGASKAWLTAAEYKEFLPFIEQDCPGISELIIPILDAGAASGRLFMGPALLAGGTLKNGKGNTPDKISHALLLAFIEKCPA